MDHDAAIPMEDDDESFCEGDPTLDDLDPIAIQRLADRQAEALAQPQGEERSMAMLGLLGEMYGDDLVVL